MYEPTSRSTNRYLPQELPNDRSIFYNSASVNDFLRRSPRRNRPEIPRLPTTKRYSSTNSRSTQLDSLATSDGMRLGYKRSERKSRHLNRNLGYSRYDDYSSKRNERKPLAGEKERVVPNSPILRNRQMNSPIKLLPSQLSSSPIKSDSFYKSGLSTRAEQSRHTSGRIYKKHDHARSTSSFFGRLKKYLGNVVDRFDADEASVNNVRSLLDFDDSAKNNSAEAGAKIGKPVLPALGTSEGVHPKKSLPPYKYQSKRVSFHDRIQDDTQLSAFRLKVQERDRIIEQQKQEISSLETLNRNQLKRHRLDTLELERTNQKIIHQREQLKAENIKLEQRFEELTQTSEVTRKEYERKSEQLAEEESRIATQLVKLEKRSKELEDLDLELDHRRFDFDQREKSLEEMELKKTLSLGLAEVKGKFEKRNVKLSQEAIKIKTMIEKHSDEFKRLRKLNGYSIGPIDLINAEDRKQYKSIFEKIENEIRFLQAHNNDRDISVDQIDSPNIEEQFQSFYQDLLKMKHAKDLKLRELTETLLVLNPTSNLNTDSKSDARKLYLRKYKILFKLKAIIEILSRMNLVLELQEDAKVLQQFAEQGKTSVYDYYAKVKKEIEERFL